MPFDCIDSELIRSVEWAMIMNSLSLVNLSIEDAYSSIRETRQGKNFIKLASSLLERFMSSDQVDDAIIQRILKMPIQLAVRVLKTKILSSHISMKLRDTLYSYFLNTRTEIKGDSNLVDSYLTKYEPFCKSFEFYNEKLAIQFANVKSLLEWDKTLCFCVCFVFQDMQFPNAKTYMFLRCLEDALSSLIKMKLTLQSVSLNLMDEMQRFFVGVLSTDVLYFMFDYIVFSLDRYLALEEFLEALSQVDLNTLTVKEMQKILSKKQKKVFLIQNSTFEFEDLANKIALTSDHRSQLMKKWQKISIQVRVWCLYFQQLRFETFGVEMRRKSFLGFRIN